MISCHTVNLMTMLNCYSHTCMQELLSAYHVPVSWRTRSSLALWTLWRVWPSPARWSRGSATCCAPFECGPQRTRTCCQRRPASVLTHKGERKLDASTWRSPGPITWATYQTALAFDLFISSAPNYVFKTQDFQRQLCKMYGCMTLWSWMSLCLSWHLMKSCRLMRHSRTSITPW